MKRFKEQRRGVHPDKDPGDVCQSAQESPHCLVNKSEKFMPDISLLKEMSGFLFDNLSKSFIEYPKQ